MAITDEQLAEWKRLAEAATPGPWTQVENCNTCDDLHLRGHGPVAQSVDATEADRTFMGAARAAVPALIAEVERLRAEVARLSGMLVRAQQIDWP